VGKNNEQSHFLEGKGKWKIKSLGKTEAKEDRISSERKKIFMWESSDSLLREEGVEAQRKKKEREPCRMGGEGRGKWILPLGKEGGTTPKRMKLHDDNSHRAMKYVRRSLGG